ncbi:MAG: Stp1/IreP family PP2C-type Ser/Thr phosphatase [Gammaproteobacteria bacterium]|nr:Stp1/IreP family PP2C-type Ser/Thr phosphatase [Gammaproteobacteria bacterium]
MNFRGVLEIASGSDTGLVRDHNEDSIGTDKDLGLAVLADGMGGYEAGEIASEIAVSHTIKEFRAAAADLAPGKLAEIDDRAGCTRAGLLLKQAVLEANSAIYHSAEEQPAFHGMGTTLVAVSFYDDRVSIVHVGDSRLYRLRGDDFKQITTDHSVLQELVDHGFCTPEQARHSPNRNLVTRALGVNKKVHIDLQETETRARDIYLLCSDGLNDMVEDADIHAIVKRFGNNIEYAVLQLINAANERGGGDNISVILVRLLKVPSTRKSWFRQLLEPLLLRFG